MRRTQVSSALLRFLWLALLALPASACAAPTSPTTSAPAVPTLEAVQQRAFSFFWNETDPVTGLTHDRARNIGPLASGNTVASTAATGYALAALPVGVAHGWIPRAQGYARALTTLRFVQSHLTDTHGFYFHFVDAKTGQRVWNSEASSIDTALLLLGARMAGAYWPGTEVSRLADALTGRTDWVWMTTEGGATPTATAPCMGWKPEGGFLTARWQGYSEAFFSYVLALGSATHPLPRADWDAWQIASGSLLGYAPVFGGAEPLFMAQMAAGYLHVAGLRDRQGRDWWAAWRNAHLADQDYCRLHAAAVPTYREGFWGLSANDLPPPTGYGVNRPADGSNDGTVSPSAMLASVIFTPDAAHAALARLWQTHRSQIWGRYGFSDAFNTGRGWYDTDVIGIDLGMMLLAVEDAHSGLPWHLLQSDPILQRGLAAAGFHGGVPGDSGRPLQRRGRLDAPLPIRLNDDPRLQSPRQFGLRLRVRQARPLLNARDRFLADAKGFQILLDQPQFLAPQADLHAEAESLESLFIFRRARRVRQQPRKDFRPVHPFGSVFHDFSS